MTLKELSQLYYLKKEIENDKQRLSELKEKYCPVSSVKLSGMPSGGVGGGGLERYVTEVVDLEAIISAKTILCIHEHSRLERYIADIPDSMTRQIFTLRFVEGYTWQQVANRTPGNNTADGVRKICTRFLKKEEKERA